MCSAVVYQLVCMGSRVSILSSCVISGDNTILVCGPGVVPLVQEQLPLRGRSLPSVISFSVRVIVFFSLSDTPSVSYCVVWVHAVSILIGYLQQR